MPSSLDRFRRPGSAHEQVAPRHEPEVQAPATEDEAELPTRFKQHCLEIRPLFTLASFPAYSQFIDTLVDNPDNPSFIALVFSHVVILVRGRNLLSHLAGLRQRNLWMIKQHATPPADATELYVESIEFIRENIPAAVAALQGSNQKQKNH